MAKRRYRYGASNGNPDYPSLGATVAKWRFRAREGLQSLTRDERRAYGDAVERAILALQRSEAQQRLTPVAPKCRCASGTAYNTGEALHQAIREQQRNALLACAAQIRRARTDVEWREMYEAAMAEKRARTIAIREAA
jgi:hypothetical protein